MSFAERGRFSPRKEARGGDAELRFDDGEAAAADD